MYLYIYSLRIYSAYLHIYTGQQQPHFPWLESMGGAGAGYTAATGHLHQHTNTYCEFKKEDANLFLWYNSIIEKKNVLILFSYLSQNILGFLV